MTTKPALPSAFARIMLPALLAALLPIEAPANTFNIADGDVAGLIAAINTANSSAGADTINLAADGTYTLTVVNNTASFPGPSGLPQITSQITINGNGATIQRSSVSGTPDFRVFMVYGDLTLNEVTIRGGRAVQGAPGFMGGGSGIRIDTGKLLLVNSTVTENSGSPILQGTGDNGGGGIFNFLGGQLTVINSTISYNTGYGERTGGGILNFTHVNVSKTTIINSTIFENRADGPSGFQGRGDAIADAFSPAGSIIVKNSILASPTQGAGNDFFYDTGYPIPWTSLGHNIVSDSSGGLTGLGDLNSTDPLLGLLAYNGGPTPTHAPLPGSPALDAVPLGDCAVATDQRGVARPQGAACDIGAVELCPLVLADVTQPGDPIVATSNNSPGSEGVANAIDNQPNKYLNFDEFNAGFTVTPNVGPTVVQGLSLTSANDAPERDPASFTLEGSNNGTTFTLIAQGTVPPFPGRFYTQVFSFPNSTPYAIYRLLFPTVADPLLANSVQISEVELLGPTAAPPVPDAASLPTITGQCSATISSAPTATDNCGGTVTGTTTDALTYTSQGTFIVTWTYVDGNGNSSSQTQTVMVQDTTPPVLACNVTTTLLWPLNPFPDVGLLITTTDACSLPVTTQVRVYSDEPKAPIMPDATYSGGILKLRAQRNGGGDGRVYLIVVTATDAVGNTTFCCKTVVVPKANNSAWVNNVNAQAANAMATCTATGSPLTPHVILP